MPWDHNSLTGRSGTIVFCAIQAIIFTYVTFSFVSFFISIILQLNAFRIYLKGLIDELNNAIDDHNAPHDFQLILRNIVRFHVVVKE